MKRREFLVGSAAALAAPAIAKAESRRALGFIPRYALTVTDPHWSSTYATRDHAYLVYDTLFGVDGWQHPSPQMVEGLTIDDEGRRWALTLRSGLKFHDGEPVLARDCVASVQRWAAHDTLGQSLMDATEELSAADDRTIVFRLKHPFPLLPYALGKSQAPVSAMMPERLAKTDPFTKVTEVVGSGPYRFKPDEWVDGSRNAYERFADYRPRESGPTDCTSGPKVAHFDRVVWTVLPDAPTALAALETGQQDWWDRVPSALLPSVRRNRDISLSAIDPSGAYMVLRPNHLQPPFNNAAIRRSLLGAIDQDEIVAAMVAGETALGRTDVGFFCPLSPMATNAGMEALTGPRDLEEVRRDLGEAGYEGEKVVALAAGDDPDGFHRTEVLVRMMREIGMNVEMQVSDIGTMFQRFNTKKGPVEEGGWSCATFFVYGTDAWDPAVNRPLRSDGAKAGAGWPNSPEIEELYRAWLTAPHLASRKEIARRMQVRAFQDVPYYPLGAYLIDTAHRKDLTEILQGFPIFWNVRRS